jgi:hypothetical protein
MGTLMRLATGFCVAFCSASVPALVLASGSSAVFDFPELAPAWGAGLVCSCDLAEGAKATVQRQKEK